MADDILAVAPDCQIISTRVFHTPRETVFRAWTEPEHLAKWWGPAGFSNTFHAFDLRPGGTWRFTMHGPDKGNYANECVFLKIERPELLAWNRLSKPIFQVVALFEEVAKNQTRVIFKMLFDNARDCGKVKPFAVEKNEENFDRLEVVLDSMAD
jgi:hypothetical protein